jgi:hypothetical protein
MRKELNRKQKEMISELMQNFNFEKCEKTMRKINWVWYHNGDYVLPNTEMLKKEALYLIESAIDGAAEDTKLKTHETFFCASGGLRASVSKNRYNIIDHVKLEFILAEWDVCYE